MSAKTTASMQEINLYLPELQPKKTSFSANFCLSASLALIVVLVLIQVIAGRALTSLEKNVVMLENQRVATDERLVKIKNKAASSSSVVLDQRIKELRTAIRDRQVVGQIIEWQNLGNEEGFAHVLESLARHSSEQFALHRIRLSGGGNALELAGETRQAEAIPLYMQALQSEEKLATTRFGLLSMGGEKPVKQFSLGFDNVYEAGGDK